MKPRYKRRIFWSVISVFAAAVLAVAIVPSWINLNNLKPKIENAIAAQTGITAQINGDIHFSMIGSTTIVAHNIVTDYGQIDSILFNVPITKIFDLSNAELTGDIVVDGARLDAQTLAPPKIANKISINNTKIKFMGRDFYIINGTLDNGMLNGIVRTSQHKYEISANGDTFHIVNRDNNLDIVGKLYDDGSAHGTLSIDTENINEWFEFANPKINRRIKVAMDFDWNGGYGFKFSNIRGDNFTGQIELFEDGRRAIQLNATNLDFDLSFLLNGSGMFVDTSIDLDLYGNLKIGSRKIWHLKISAIGTKTDIQIKNIVADDMIIDGGTVTANGATDMAIRLPINKIPAFCRFSGDPINWKCSEFTYGKLYGSLEVNGDTFDVSLQSDQKMPEDISLNDMTKILGSRGTINFLFTDIGGTINVKPDAAIPSYKFAKNKSIEWLHANLYFLPEQMRTATGDFVWDGGEIKFTPHSKRWEMSLRGNFFYISGLNFKDWFVGADLRSLNDLEYIISGIYKNNNISNLEIKIAGHVFAGSVNGDNLTLATDILNMDSFVNQKYIDNYDEEQFLSNDPLLIPFGIPANISLSANSIIHNGDEYANFVYSSKSGVQTLSITDDARGSMLATITKNPNNKYDVTLQLNRFVITNKLLASNMPINISDTVITAEARLSTSGQIAYDIWQNMYGTVDMSFDGGMLYGFGFDNFYANTGDITTLNAEYKLAAALDGGASQIKKAHIVGIYDGGNFASTDPFTLSMRHTDATGVIQTSGGKMAANMNLILRGTSPSPAPIDINVLPDGSRKYSLSQIMINFDPDFLRDFVATHDRF